MGDLIYADTTTSLAKLADVAVGSALISGGVGAAPSYGKIGLATHVSGTLPIANGGTNSTATPTNGGITYGTGSAQAYSVAGTSGQVLQSNGAAAPTWLSQSSIAAGSATNATLATTATLATLATLATTANATAAALTAGSFLTSGGTFNGSTARTFAVDATNLNTASKVVARDASGNFSAGTITATLSGAASSATNATFASSATNATFASSATNASAATNATFASSATNATFASSATNASAATNATLATLATLATTAGKLSTAGGSAPSYSARAWVNFLGSSGGIRASQNVSSVTRNGTGDYTVNFSTAMSDANFAGNVNGSGVVNGQHLPIFLGSPGSNDTSSHPSASAFRFSAYNVTNSGLRGDPSEVNVSIHR